MPNPQKRETAPKNLICKWQERTGREEANNVRKHNHNPLEGVREHRTHKRTINYGGRNKRKMQTNIWNSVRKTRQSRNIGRERPTRTTKEKRKSQTERLGISNQ